MEAVPEGTIVLRPSGSDVVEKAHAGGGEVLLELGGAGRGVSTITDDRDFGELRCCGGKMRAWRGCSLVPHSERASKSASMKTQRRRRRQGEVEDGVRRPCRRLVEDAVLARVLQVFEVRQVLEVFKNRHGAGADA